jgi:hypothetical protein
MAAPAFGLDGAKRGWTANIDPPKQGPFSDAFAKLLQNACKTSGSDSSKPMFLLANRLGNGVTVAFRVLGQAVDIATPVLQQAIISDRLFPGTSAAFAKLSDGVRTTEFIAYALLLVTRRRRFWPSAATFIWSRKRM